ncbi:MAG TPA: isochorismatase family protein, partial [Candidatus Binatia bacterium]
MAIENFEDHCWKDVVTPEILKTYTPYQRETYIGQRPALLAIDLYNLAYEGGAKEPHELVDTYKSSCGIYAHNAIKPTQELFTLARSLKIPVFYTTSETRKEAKPDVINATNRQRVKIDPQAFEIKEEFKPQSGDVVIFKERASGFFGTPLVAHL